MRVIFEFPTIEKLSAQVEKLRQARVLCAIAGARSGVNEILERVASMPESRVQELIRELRMEERP
jgi:hypothetical protein